MMKKEAGPPHDTVAKNMLMHNSSQTFGCFLKSLPLMLIDSELFSEIASVHVSNFQ